MKVQIDSESFLVSWRHGNTVLQQWLSAANVSKAEAKVLPHAELKGKLSGVMSLVKAKDIPASDYTECTIIDADTGDVVAEGTVRRNPRKNHNKHKARVYSLADALDQTFSGDTYKEFRTKFWEAYLATQKIDVKQTARKQTLVNA